jgi:replicative DNA helicase
MSNFYSIPAEQSVLGALMIDNSAWDKISSNLTEDDFFENHHKTVFRTIVKLAENQKAFDVVTMSDVLDKSDEHIKGGWLYYLGTIARDTPSSANVKTYAGIVKECSILRQIQRINTELTEDLTQNLESKTILDDYIEKLSGISQLNSDSKLKNIKEYVLDAIEEVEYRIDNEENLNCIKTGFADLDEATDGFNYGDLIILAGRPSMGKTSLAMNIAEHAAIFQKKTGIVFSMEMSGVQIAKRSISSVGEIDGKLLRNGKLEDSDWARFTTANNSLGNINLFIDESTGLIINEIRSRCKEIVALKGKLDFIVVDYLRKMRSINEKKPAHQQIEEFTSGLKAIAKEFNCAVIALSQLNRNLELRPNKRPIMSDLRESGAIEQDADVIIFVYRDEVYNPDSPDKGVAELILGKARNDALATIRVLFLGMYTKFKDMAKNQYKPEDYE